MSELITPMNMAYICFWLWLTGTLAVFYIGMTSKQRVQGKFDSNDPYHILLRSTIMVWLAMWCFRTMV